MTIKETLIDLFEGDEVKNCVLKHKKWSSILFKKKRILPMVGATKTVDTIDWLAKSRQEISASDIF